jgi:predicted HTH domain antitoxin
MPNVHVEFELPTVLVSQAGLDPQDINREVRLMLALFLYEHKRISLEKACELGGISQWEFADLIRQMGIPLHYSTTDLAEDLERLANV